MKASTVSYTRNKRHNKDWLITDNNYYKAAPARNGKMGVSSPIAIVAGASQRKPREREIG